MKEKIDNWKYYTKGKTYGDEDTDPICKCGTNWAYNDKMPESLPSMARCPDCGFTIRWFKISGSGWELIKRDEEDNREVAQAWVWIEGGNYIYYDKTSLKIKDIEKTKKNCDLQTGWIYITEAKSMGEILEILMDKEEHIIKMPKGEKKRILELVNKLDGYIMSRENQKEYWNEIGEQLRGLK